MVITSLSGQTHLTSILRPTGFWFTTTLEDLRSPTRALCPLNESISEPLGANQGLSFRTAPQQTCLPQEFKLGWPGPTMNPHPAPELLSGWHHTGLVSQFTSLPGMDSERLGTYIECLVFVRWVTWIILYNRHSSPLCRGYFPHFIAEDLRLSEIQEFTQGHASCIWKTQNLKIHLLDSRTFFLSMNHAAS